MTKSYEFNWQKHLPEFMQEGASFDRFDEVRRSKARGVKKKKRGATPKRDNQADSEDAAARRLVLTLTH